jgi:hypothetical protein
MWRGLFGWSSVAFQIYTLVDERVTGAGEKALISRLNPYNPFGVVDRHIESSRCKADRERMHEVRMNNNTRKI